MSDFDFDKIDKSKWKKYRFDQIALSISERVEPNDTDLEIYVGLEHIDSDSVHIKRTGVPSDVGGTKLRVHPGDVIFGKRRAYQRKAAIAEFDGICSAHAMVLRANEKVIDNKLFPFFLHSDYFMHRAIDISVGSLSPTINWGTLKSQEFFLPPKDHQVRLAKLLWAADEATQKYQDLYQTEQDFLSVFFRNEFSNLSARGVADTCSLRDIGSWQSGGTPSKKEEKYWVNGNFLWVTPKDAKANEISDSEDKVSSIALDETNSCLFPSGAFCIVWRSGILQHTLPIIKVNLDFTINQDMKVFVPKKQEVLSEYVRIYLLIYREEIRQKSVKGGTTVQSIDTDSFLKWKIPVPSPKIQDHLIGSYKKHIGSQILTKKCMVNTQHIQKQLINQIFSA